jgi:LacI family transcriptional regulator
MGLIKGLNEMGKKVPEDISVVGYDDIFYTEYMIPSLTTIRQDIFKKGMMAAGLLLAQINGEPVPEQSILLPVELKVRASTAKRLEKGCE